MDVVNKAEERANWRANPYSVRYFIEYQHDLTRAEIEQLNLSVLGVSEQVEEVQREMGEISHAIYIVGRVVIICVIIIVTAYLTVQWGG